MRPRHLCVSEHVRTDTVVQRAGSTFFQPAPFPLCRSSFYLKYMTQASRAIIYRSGQQRQSHALWLYMSCGFKWPPLWLKLGDRTPNLAAALLHLCAAGRIFGRGGAFWLSGLSSCWLGSASGGSSWASSWATPTYTLSWNPASRACGLGFASGGSSWVSS